jgi:hypothetical protein
MIFFGWCVVQDCGWIIILLLRSPVPFSTALLLEELLLTTLILRSLDSVAF